jgi:hypothetical protein
MRRTRACFVALRSEVDARRAFVLIVDLGVFIGFTLEPSFVLDLAIWTSGSERRHPSHRPDPVKAGRPQGQVRKTVVNSDPDNDAPFSQERD